MAGVETEFELIPGHREPLARYRLKSPPAKREIIILATKNQIRPGNPNLERILPEEKPHGKKQSK